MSLVALLWPFTLSAQTGAGSSAFTNPPIVLTVEGTNVWIQRFRSNIWESAFPNQVLRVKDRGRTGADSRTSIRLSDLSVLRIGWHSEFEIQPMPEPDVDAEFSLWRGLMRLFNRDRPGRHRFVTPTATAATRGTEFVLEVEEDTGRTVLTVFEGEAEMSNALGSVRIVSGEQGVAVGGQPPSKTAVIDATAIVQWCLYYPGVLDLAELPLPAAEEAALSVSLGHYRQGDLLRALSAYPAGRAPETDAERIYLAAVLLAAGHVEQSESLLDAIESNDPLSRTQRLAGALRLVVDAVNLRERPSTRNRQPATHLATELLAESYYHQSRFDLAAALESARQSVEISPEFAFGLVRVAELEFSHGRIDRALALLDEGYWLAPRNAQALALRGFLLSAQNRIDEAVDWFEEAMAIDGGLGNAWLGRGLCRIRRGDVEGGRYDLQVAAALEPQRSLLRSYLGKAFDAARDTRHAEKELGIATQLDPADPTPWLYSALLLRDLNRINEAVRNLEHSQELNDNRRVYRSRLLLDQDRAVRGANLARVYRDAGMTEVSVREAGRAVNADYANHSAHRFLADSFNELRDLNQINLRYETAWFTEYLVANLLAPVGAGPLSQTVSQQEYSKLFQRDGFGLTSATEYYSHGEWIQSAAQFGTFVNGSYAVETFYHHDNGHRPNNDLEQFATVLNLKQQITPQDSLYLRLNYYDANYGDVNQYFDQANANPELRFSEHYDPSLLAGYHHEWSPEHHTLVLAGSLDNTFEASNPVQGAVFLERGLASDIIAVAPLLYEQDYRSHLALYTGELQHLWRQGNHSIVAGGRVQSGHLDVRNEQINGRRSSGVSIPLTITNDVSPSFQRYSVYVYDHWQIHPAFLLAAGMSYDMIDHPDNYRYAPVTEGQRTDDQISPKAGFIWTPTPSTTLRGAWFRALGGVTLDQSIRLEPSQVAGFNQAYRSLIPEAVAGANAAPTFETWAVSLEQKFGRGTFVAVSGEFSRSEVRRTVGAVEFDGTTGFSASGTREQLDYGERALALTFNQLLGDEWSLGAGYRISHAELDDDFSDIPASAAQVGGFQRNRSLEATLQQGNVFALYNHPSGFFARSGAIWTSQSNHGDTPDRPGDDFWQFNIEAGWRFAQRRAEVSVGLLNLTDQDYKLNPLNLTQDLPRERTLAVSAQFNF